MQIRPSKSPKTAARKRFHTPAPFNARPGALPGLIGVLGGMGPLATVDFMRKMVQATPATRDQDHAPALISSIPQIPDRTRAFQGKGETPLPALLACAQRLEAAGAGVIVIPCNTAHLWFDAIQAEITIPMLHIVDAALKMASTFSGITPRIGLLATEATIASGLYTHRAHGAAVEWLLPGASEIREWVTPGIAAVKAGRLDAGRALLLQAALALQQRGAAALVLGCTEIPVVLDDANCPLPTIDATAALAQGAVDWSRHMRSR